MPGRLTPTPQGRAAFEALLGKTDMARREPVSRNFESSRLFRVLAYGLTAVVRRSGSRAWPLPAKAAVTADMVFRLVLTQAV
jgi:hypothetical protein